MKGHERVVKMLLEKEEVNPTRQTPNMAGHRSGWPLAVGVMGSKYASRTEVSAPPY